MDIPYNTKCKIIYQPDTFSHEAEMMVASICDALMAAEIPFHIGQQNNDFAEYAVEIRTQSNPSDVFYFDEVI